MERELVKMFLDSGWQALRIAGSGKMNLAPDVLAGRPGQLLIIECKSTKKKALYIDKTEILNVINYAAKIGGEPWYGARFDRMDWKFVPAQNLLENHKISPEQGIDFEMLKLKDKKTI